MHACAVLVGLKSENVEKVLVFKAFLKGPPTESILNPGGGGSPGRDIERGKPLFRRKMEKVTHPDDSGHKGLAD